VDRLVLIHQGKKVGDFAYTRRCRRSMTRLQRKLERLLPEAEGKVRERPPEWLEAVARAAESREFCPKCGHAIPGYAEGTCPRCLQKRRILFRLRDVARPYRLRLWLGLALTLIWSLANVLPPYLMKHIVDDGILAGDRSALLKWSLFTIGLAVLIELVDGFRLWVLSVVGTQVTRDLRIAVYAHMHDLSLRYFAKRRTGSLITRVMNDTDRLWDFIVFGWVDLFRSLIMIVAIASVMFWIDWRLAWVALLPLPILAVFSYIRGRRMQRLHGRLWTYWSRMGAVVGDAIPGVRVVKAFANEKREVRRFEERNTEYVDKEIEIHRAWTSMVPAMSLLMQLGVIVVWLAGGYMVINASGSSGKHSITLGVLVAFASYLHRFYGPVRELANSNRMVTRAATSAQRVFEVLDTPPDVYTQPGALVKEHLEGRVEFRQVSFSYEGAQPALREVSMSAEPGEMIGLCGPSGAGKSTFVNLICRFYDVTDGQILIDGVDIRDYDVRWLRRQIGVVLQEPYLFHGTIADNIRYGNPEATDEQVITAARAANAHDFIVGFPDGYDTMVGERGQSLSGGERQRISIARAILHNPRILILDEATSSLDTETEKQIQQALDRLVHGRTTFAIAHRLSTLQAADRLIVLENGRIAETGTHGELVDKADGVYAKLHRTQMEMSTRMAIR
jgi:ATP-binding cassette subfamily B protein